MVCLSYLRGQGSGEHPFTIGVVVPSVGDVVNLASLDVSVACVWVYWRLVSMFSVIGCNIEDYANIWETFNISQMKMESKLAGKNTRLIRRDMCSCTHLHHGQ